MMDEAQRKAVKRAIQRQGAKNAATKKAAKAFLVRKGYLTKAGKLSPDYGGHATVKHEKELIEA